MANDLSEALYQAKKDGVPLRTVLAMIESIYRGRFSDWKWIEREND